MMTISETAVGEVAALLRSKDAPADHGLRISVERGGCAGWQYLMQVAAPQSGDQLVVRDDARVIVAADSLDLLRGCEIDFADELSDRGFRINNPNSSRNCGCGTSFEAPAPDGSAAPEAQPDGTVCGD
jgi:iron-sulfur cluster assembly accessory protein